MIGLLAGALVLAVALAVRAAEDPVYTIRDVALDVRAKTAARARGLALSRGQRLAIGRLFARLTPREEQPRLPVLDDARITSLVSGIDVRDERYSSKRYLASVTYHFNKEAVRDLLSLTGIPFSETPAPPLVVLPGIDIAGTRQLWEPGNPWRAAWQGLDLKRGLVPVVLPRRGITLISADQATAGADEKLLATISHRYNGAEVMVAWARLSHEVASGRVVLTIEMTRYGAAGVRSAKLRLTGESRDAVLARAADRVLTTINEDWKRYTLIDFTTHSGIAAVAPLRQLSDWLALRDRLATVGVVRKLRLERISVTMAHLNIEFQGRAEGLAVSLERAGITVTPRADGADGWMLGLAPKQQPQQPERQ